ncbi:redox-sensing transcriptional repressor Rex [Paenibacillus alginolyticus]|uniref:Redox-sensing transcriptional repressor Rex n=1 Tax=Paenibacillus alginolyticus TaxID=59839 RepID=A0ABT4GCT3_9BACL|nr:redox-sensing transcriptional repressor Rex [Paenibacillus alginolyticus]MCY9693983.1 redox-sensing transcriptional repressor Rex [Paenibacillus alginolyticus]MEC0142651.1 redox-sensing transcriptional repressor Rex [Paenibacillus alginolyticus]
MKTQKISEAVVRRLPIYLRYLNELAMKNVSTVSSQDLGQKLDLNPAQIRKDLAYFGEFGKKGIGYDIAYLIEKIRQILKLDRHIQVALVGAGNLGRALCNYNTYLRNDMKIVAVFDAMPSKAGESINNLIVQPMHEMKKVLSELGVRIGIITVPANEAQNVANQFVDCGIEAILNFAPVIIKVPPEVRVHHADFTTELQSLAYYLD